MSFAIIELGDCRLHDGRQSTCNLQKTRVLRREMAETARIFLTRLVALEDLIRQKCPIITNDILGCRAASGPKRLPIGDLQRPGATSAAMASPLLVSTRRLPDSFRSPSWRPP